MKFRRPLPSRPLGPWRPHWSQSYVEKQWSRTARKSFTNRPEQVGFIDGLDHTELLHPSDQGYDRSPEEQMEWRYHQHQSQQARNPRYLQENYQQHPGNYRPAYDNYQNKENDFNNEHRRSASKDQYDLNYLLGGPRRNYNSGSPSRRNESLSPRKARDIRYTSPEYRQRSRTPPRRQNYAYNNSERNSSYRSPSRRNGSPYHESRRRSLSPPRMRRYDRQPQRDKSRDKSSRSPKAENPRNSPYDNKRKYPRSRSSSRERAKIRKSAKLSSTDSPNYKSDRKRQRKRSCSNSSSSDGTNNVKEDLESAPKQRKMPSFERGSIKRESISSPSNFSSNYRTSRLSKTKNPYVWVRPGFNASPTLSPSYNDDLLDNSQRSEEAESDYNGDNNVSNKMVTDSKQPEKENDSISSVKSVVSEKTGKSIEDKQTKNDSKASVKDVKKISDIKENKIEINKHETVKQIKNNNNCNVPESIDSLHVETRLVEDITTSQVDKSEKSAVVKTKQTDSGEGSSVKVNMEKLKSKRDKLAIVSKNEGILIKDNEDILTANESSMIKNVKPMKSNYETTTDKVVSRKKDDNTEGNSNSETVKKKQIEVKEDGVNISKKSGNNFCKIKQLQNTLKQSTENVPKMKSSIDSLLTFISKEKANVKTSSSKPQHPAKSLSEKDVPIDQPVIVLHDICKTTNRKEETHSDNKGPEIANQTVVSDGKWSVGQKQFGVKESKSDKCNKTPADKSSDKKSKSRHSSGGVITKERKTIKTNHKPITNDTRHRYPSSSKSKEVERSGKGVQHGSLKKKNESLNESNTGKLENNVSNEKKEKQVSKEKCLNLESKEKHVAIESTEKSVNAASKEQSTNSESNERKDKVSKEKTVDSVSKEKHDGMKSKEKSLNNASRDKNENSESKENHGNIKSKEKSLDTMSKEKNVISESKENNMESVSKEKNTSSESNDTNVKTASYEKKEKVSTEKNVETCTLSKGMNEICQSNVNAVQNEKNLIAMLKENNVNNTPIESNANTESKEKNDCSTTNEKEVNTVQKEKNPTVLSEGKDGNSVSIEENRDDVSGGNNENVTKVKGVHSTLPACIPSYKRLFKSYSKSKNPNTTNSEIVQLTTKSNESSQNVISEKANVGPIQNDNGNDSQQEHSDMDVDPVNNKLQDTHNADKIDSLIDKNLVTSPAKDTNNTEKVFSAVKASLPNDYLDVVESKPVDSMDTNFEDEDDIMPIEMIGSVFTNEKDLDAEDYEQNDFIEGQMCTLDSEIETTVNEMKVKYCDDVLKIKMADKAHALDEGNERGTLSSDTSVLSDDQHDNTWKKAHSTPRKKFADTLKDLSKTLQQQIACEEVCKPKHKKIKKTVVTKVISDASSNKDTSDDEELVSSGIDLTPSKHSPDSKDWLKKAKTKAIRIPTILKDKHESDKSQPDQGSKSPESSSDENKQEKQPYNNSGKKVDTDKHATVKRQNSKTNDSDKGGKSKTKQKESSHKAEALSLTCADKPQTDKLAETKKIFSESSKSSKISTDEDEPTHVESDLDLQQDETPTTVADKNDSEKDTSVEDKPFDISVFNKEIEVGHSKYLTNDYTQKTTAFLVPKRMYKTSLTDGKNLGKCLRCSVCSMYFTPLSFTLHHDTQNTQQLIDPVKSKKQEYRLVEKSSKDVVKIFKDFVDYFHALREQCFNVDPVRPPRTKTPPMMKKKEQEVKETPTVNQQTVPNVTTMSHVVITTTPFVVTTTPLVANNSPTIFETNVNHQPKKDGVNSNCEVPNKTVFDVPVINRQDNPPDYVTAVRQSRLLVSDKQNVSVSDAAHKNGGRRKHRSESRRMSGSGPTTNVSNVTMFNPLTAPLMNGNLPSNMPHSMNNYLQNGYSLDIPNQGIPMNVQTQNVNVPYTDTNQSSNLHLQQQQTGYTYPPVSTQFSSVPPAVASIPQSQYATSTSMVYPGSALLTACEPVRASQLNNINLTEITPQVVNSHPVHQIYNNQPPVAPNGSVPQQPMVNRTSCVTESMPTGSVPANFNPDIYPAKFDTNQQHSAPQNTNLYQTKSGQNFSSPLEYEKYVMSQRYKEQVSPEAKGICMSPQTSRPSATHPQPTSTSTSTTNSVTSNKVKATTISGTQLLAKEERKRELLEELCMLEGINTSDNGLNILLLSDKLKIRGLSTVDKAILKKVHEKNKNSEQQNLPLSEKERINRIIALKSTVDKSK